MLMASKSAEQIKLPGQTNWEQGTSNGNKKSESGNEYTAVIAFSFPEPIVSLSRLRGTLYALRTRNTY